MQELRLVAVSEDGTYLVLATAGRGTRFTLPVDDRLRAAVRGNFSRLGQYEIEVESPLRPKEIQTRIRAGETAEEIAATAGIPVERVRWFEGPVLQEREYMAQQAQRVAVRLPGETTPGPTLGELVAERLTRRGVPADEIDWDSCKRDDNLWRVKLGFVWNGHTRHAEWLFDPRRRYITPNDDEAMRLSAADYVEPSAMEKVEDTTVRPFLPRLTPVPPLATRFEPPPAARPEPLRPEPLRPEPAARVEPLRGEPVARHEPTVRREPPAAWHDPVRPEPSVRHEPPEWHGPRSDKPAALRSDKPAAPRADLAPVPFRLPDPLAGLDEPADEGGSINDRAGEGRGADDRNAGANQADGRGIGMDQGDAMSPAPDAPVRRVDTAAPEAATTTPAPATTMTEPATPAPVIATPEPDVTPAQATATGTTGIDPTGTTDTPEAALPTPTAPPPASTAPAEPAAAATERPTAPVKEDGTPKKVTPAVGNAPATEHRPVAGSGHAAPAEAPPAATAPPRPKPRPRPRPTVPAARPASDAPAASSAPSAKAPVGAPEKEPAKDAELPAPPVPKPAPPRPRKSRRRASVPTWDEIMFGARKQD